MASARWVAFGKGGKLVDHKVQCSPTAREEIEFHVEFDTRVRFRFFALLQPRHGTESSFSRFSRAIVDISLEIPS